MSRRLVILFVSVVFLTLSGCAEKRAYFGVPNQSVTVPEAFKETDRAISEAERSPGVAYCPDKLERAKKLAREGVEAWWACYSAKAMELLANARALAKEATQCQPPPPPPPPPARPVPPPAPEARLPQGVVIPNAFRFDSLSLNPNAYRMLDEQAVVLKNNPQVRVQIIGHTDGIGTESYNKSLGRRRALSAKEYLEKKGIAPSRMEVLSAGKDQPMATNNTEEGRATNRRIELKYVR